MPETPPNFCFNAVVMQEGPNLFVDPSCQLLSRAYLQVYYKLNSCLGITEDRRFRTFCACRASPLSVVSLSAIHVAHNSAHPSQR